MASEVGGRFRPELPPASLRLSVAAILGGAIGLERELKHRPTGLRTLMFICFGSAMFTLLSERLASEFTGDHTRIAAQIIPGIGFIGGGAILHDKGSVSGLTSAATIFVAAGHRDGGGWRSVSNRNLLHHPGPGLPVGPGTGGEAIQSQADHRELTT